MRKLGIAAGLILGLTAAAAVASGSGERRAVAQQAVSKPMTMVGPPGSNIGVTAGAIQRVGVFARGQAGASLEIDGIAGKCIMVFSTASDAAAMAARVTDAKATAVACEGPVQTINGGIIPINNISAATQVIVWSSP